MILRLPAGAFGPEPVEADVRAFLVDYGRGLVLIDTGFADEPASIEQKLAELGAGWSDVSDVLLTHDHPDHTGGLARIRELAPAAVIRGDTADHFEGPVAPLSEGMLIRTLEVLGLPGHTPGHVGFIDTSTGAVFAGDAVGSVDGSLVRSPDMFTADREQAERSLLRLAEVTTSRLLPSHGAEVADPVGAIRALSRTAGR
jgi:glyoxylase-like metal-dependent hydrolase (beta-lactamase superfamily II)